MRYTALILAAAAALTGCTWETYQNESGHTSLRPKYEKGTRIYYEDGTYSRDMRYNQIPPRTPHPQTAARRPRKTYAARHGTNPKGAGQTAPETQTEE